MEQGVGEYLVRWDYLVTMAPLETKELKGREERMEGMEQEVSDTFVMYYYVCVHARNK